MLSRRLPIFPATTGDWATDGPRLYRAFREYFDWLNSPGSLNLTQTRIENCTFPSGDWTPTIIGSSTAGTQTYTAQIGRYVDFGQVVWVSGRVVLSAVGGTIAGNALIGGLPFTTATESALVGSVSVSGYDYIDLSAGYTQLGIVPTPNATTLTLLESGDNVLAQLVAVAAIGADAAVLFSGLIKKG